MKRWREESPPVEFSFNNFECSRFETDQFSNPFKRLITV